VQGPKGLLAIEVFAGSHPVARHFKEIRLQTAQQPPLPYSLVAYAAIEAKEGQKYRAPGPEALGLAPKHYLDLHGNVQHLATQGGLLRFVRSGLRSCALDEVVVFGGPPCRAYSNANVHRQQHEQALINANDTLADARGHLHQQLLTGATGSAAGAFEEFEAEARRRLDKAQAAWDVYKTAADAVEKDVLDALEADEVVSDFLALFKDIQRECQAAAHPATL
jgi:hypothetical protein